MEEKQATIDGVSRPVPDPFFVIATQNPIEYQGTFPLPEAQMDRFALAFSLGYPTETEELQMLQRLQQGMAVDSVQPCLSVETLQNLRQTCTQVQVATPLQRYILALVRATRDADDITLGVSPRGSVVLQRTIQALAFLEGRDFAIPDDVKFLAPYVLPHRMIPAGGRKAQPLVNRLLESVPIP